MPVGLSTYGKKHNIEATHNLKIWRNCLYYSLIGHLRYSILTSRYCDDRCVQHVPGLQHRSWVAGLYTYQSHAYALPGSSFRWYALLVRANPRNQGACCLCADLISCQKVNVGWMFMWPISPSWVLTIPKIPLGTLERFSDTEGFPQSSSFQN